MNYDLVDTTSQMRSSILSNTSIELDKRKENK